MSLSLSAQLFLEIFPHLKAPTTIFCSPGSLGSDYESKVGSSLHSVLQDQFSKEVNTAYLEDTSLSEDSKKLQTLLSYKVQ